MKRLIGLILLSLTLDTRAEDAAAILARSDAYRNSLDSFSIDVELTAHDGKDVETSKFRVYGKGSDRSVVEFLAPAAEKGKYLLMLRDAMWIYMPSSSRPIRISPLQRLMGQASNGDVARTSFTVDYTPVSATEHGDEWMLELHAKDPSIAYRKVQLWIDRTTHEPRRADFYVASGKLLKRAHFREYTVMSGRRTVSVIEIEDLVRPGRRTEMRYANLVARQNPDNMFTREALAKW
ncbi:MAG TPA: outer membrane lipoprotein-sorting protein [Thermoanaerobaculia bacterium]|nr:outer membrane lipoprotein-sorting protein [Thermoanaerobaculia bacterium]